MHTQFKFYSMTWTDREVQIPIPREARPVLGTALSSVLASISIYSGNLY